MSGSTPAPVIDQDEWGICGFVSVLNALHEAGPLVRFGHALSIDQIHERLAVEVVTFLKFVAAHEAIADGDTRVIGSRAGLADRIVAFSRELGGTATTLNGLVSEIEGQVITASVAIGSGSAGSWAHTWGDTVVAMPVSGMCAYLEWHKVKHSLRATPLALNGATLSGQTNCVVGLSDTRRPRSADPECGILRHWVYVDRGGIVLNWGARVDVSGGLPANLTSKYDGICHVIELL
ncbi:hypothetical protein [Roseomonas fluvialis]|uniref:Peptidase C39-like domain-containing protein n=1 Tax=Roseomonas fluvialis TaxID=1750527 RepID=A0ABM7Y4K1_9PROT|nr:hypothetical protein [Roseomonas fluvialis]BDG72793.1 hypothetical protein Rmf_27220 [Roseomonas fluvialis]